MATTLVQNPTHTGSNFKRDWSYLVPMGLLSLMMLGAATVYFAKAEMLAAEFVRLGFPTWVRPMLGVAKAVGIGIIWFWPSAPLRHFAYAGFLYNFVAACFAHGYTAEHDVALPLVALTLLGLAMWRDPRG